MKCASVECCLSFRPGPVRMRPSVHNIGAELGSPMPTTLARPPKIAQLTHRHANGCCAQLCHASQPQSHTGDSLAPSAPCAVQALNVFHTASNVSAIVAHAEPRQQQRSSLRLRLGGGVDRVRVLRCAGPVRLGRRLARHRQYLFGPEELQHVAAAHQCEDRPHLRGGAAVSDAHRRWRRRRRW
eukprot:1178569-Prymnesium_polylepis.1